MASFSASTDINIQALTNGLTLLTDAVSQATSINRQSDERVPVQDPVRYISTQDMKVLIHTAPHGKLWNTNIGSVDKKILLSITSHRNLQSHPSKVELFNSLNGDVKSMS